MKSADQAGPDIFYATEINGIQFAVPASALKTIKLSPPETNQEFWQQTYLKQHLYEYFGERGYNSKLRKEVDEECRDYLYKLEEIGYEDDFITSYVQNIFAKLTATGIDPNRSERLNVRVIQSPEPDAYMLPNGTMLISTGLLCTLDSEDELAAIIANEMSHFVLDLANSRYLDIDVKKENYVEENRTLIEDTRFNRPAKDGEEFTDPGIYTIMVSNQYTKSNTEKKIYVGTDPILKAYVTTGEDIDQIKKFCSIKVHNQLTFDSEQSQ